MRVIFDGDMPEMFVSGDVAGGVEVPGALRHLPLKRLRLVGDAVVDAAAFDTFHIGADGRKHVVAAADRQELACGWDDRIVADASTGLWRLWTQADAPLTRLEFRQRFTFPEQVAIKAAAKTDDEVAVIEDLFLAAEEIVPSNATTGELVSLLVAKGLITEARKAEILMP